MLEVPDYLSIDQYLDGHTMDKTQVIVVSMFSILILKILVFGT